MCADGEIDKYIGFRQFIAVYSAEFNGLQV